MTAGSDSRVPAEACPECGTPCRVERHKLHVHYTPIEAEARLLTAQLEQAASPLLTAQLEQAASRKAALIEALRHVEEDGCDDPGENTCLDLESPAPCPSCYASALLSDLSVASEQYLAGVRADAVAKERERLRPLLAPLLSHADLIALLAPDTGETR